MIEEVRNASTTEGSRNAPREDCSIVFTTFTGFAGTALAADPASCETVRLSDPGWTDITSTNSIASVLLEGLGYKPDVKTMSVPIGYEALKTGNLDVFLGNWMPAQQNSATISTRPRLLK